MKNDEVRKHVLGFMYAERLKSALLIAGQLLVALSDLEKEERAGGFKIFAAFVKAAGNEMRLAANVMGTSDWDALSGRLNVTEGYARLGQMEAAQEELSRSLSRVTTLSAHAMTPLRSAGLV